MNKNIKKIIYIADISLPSFRAKIVHIFKMVDNFCDFFKEVELIVKDKSKVYLNSNIIKDFNLHNKHFRINSIFGNKKKDNFINRIIFGYISAKKVDDKNSLIITRSFYVSFALFFFKKKHFLEIHQELSGLTKFFFKLIQIFGYHRNIKIIFITKALSNYYKKFNLKNIILPDAVDLRDFDENNKICIKRKKFKKIKKIFYVGSFYRGRGVELILEIAKKMPDKIFYLYGKRNEKFNIDTKYKNIKFFKFVKYNQVPLILKKADLLLMPYSLSNVLVNSKNVDTSNYASPMKMFEYLASGIPMISSNLPVLKEILRDNYNCIISNNNSVSTWVKSIRKIDKDIKLRKKISINSLITAKNNTWKKRILNILEYSNDQLNVKNPKK